MRKKKTGKIFSRQKPQREALLKNLSAELFMHDKIKTTEAKAKEIKRVAEKSVTRAKKGDLHNKRQLLKSYREEVVKKLIKEIAPRYKDREGGYTRLTKLGLRRSDGARMAILKLVE